MQPYHLHRSNHMICYDKAHISLNRLEICYDTYAWFYIDYMHIIFYCIVYVENYDLSLRQRVGLRNKPVPTGVC